MGGTVAQGGVLLDGQRPTPEGSDSGLHLTAQLLYQSVLATAAHRVGLLQSRRNIEFRRYLSHLVAYARRQGMKKIILLVDHASAHKTAQIKKFLKEHPMLKII